MKPAVFVVLALIVWGFPAFLLGAALTGRTPRAYKVLLPDDLFLLAGAQITAQEAAATYRPTILDSPGHRPPDPTVMWYEVVAPADGAVTIVYRPGWEDEQHPNPVVNVLYRWYRQAVYGSAQDMEYIQVMIDQPSGQVDEVQFETAPDGDFNRSYTEHLNATLTREKDILTLRIVDASGKVITSSAPLPDARWSPGSPLSFYVQTWNHLYTLKPPSWEVEPLDMPLRFLDDDSYRQLKMSWRSQGSVYTAKNSLARIVTVALLWFFPVALIVLVWQGQRGAVTSGQ